MKDFLKEDEWFVAVTAAWAIFAIAVVLGLCVQNAYAFGGNVGKVQSTETGACYQTYREKRTFAELYKSNSIYRYHLVAPLSCDDFRFPPDPHANRHAWWDVLEIRTPGVGTRCFDVMYMPVQNTVDLRKSTEMSVGQEISCGPAY